MTENVGGKWEVVNTKQKKKQKEKDRQDKKNQEKMERKKQEELEEMRKQKEKDRFYQQYVAAKAPDVSENAFGMLEDADEKLKEKEDKRREREERKAQFELDGAMEVLHFAEDPKKKKSKGSGAPSTPKQKVSKAENLALSDAAAKLSKDSVKGVISNYSQKYPNNYDVQLKGLAEHFEIIFNAAGNVEFTPDNTEEPVELVKQDVVDTVKQWIDKVPEDSLVFFFLFLVTTLVNIAADKKNNKPLQTKGTGLRVMIQMLCRWHPSVLLKNFGYFREQFFSQTNQPLNSSVIPTLLWVIYQPVNYHIGVVTSAWFQFLLPLNLEPSTPEDIQQHSISLLQRVTQSKYYFVPCEEYSVAENHSRNRDFMDEATAVRSYERMLLLSVDSKLPSSLRTLLPTLTDPDFYFAPGIVPKRLFTMLLGHAATDKEQLRNLVLAQLVRCMETEDNCVNYWVEGYSKYIAQSNNLMLYIHIRWDPDKLYRKLKAQDLLLATKQFAEINQLLAEGTFVDPKSKKTKKANTPAEQKEIEMCNITCKALQKKLKKYTPRKGGLARLCLTFVPTMTIILGAAYYAANHCCDLDWCRQVPLFTELLHCDQLLAS